MGSRCRTLGAARLRRNRRASPIIRIAGCGTDSDICRRGVLPPVAGADIDTVGGLLVPVATVTLTGADVAVALRLRGLVRAGGNPQKGADRSDPYRADEGMSHSFCF